MNLGSIENKINNAEPLNVTVTVSLDGCDDLWEESACQVFAFPVVTFTSLWLVTTCLGSPLP